MRDFSKDYSGYATACVEALQQKWYNKDKGCWNEAEWWNAANTLNAIIDYSVLNKTDRYHEVIKNTFEKNKEGLFWNRYYDDQGWWALTWINAYDFVREIAYLNMAETIFHQMLLGWDEKFCGGGMWWNEDKHYKNAITNELFLLIAARLYLRTDKEEYFVWARIAWEWFCSSGMINEQYLVNDGLSDCHNNGDVTWTYNQGVILSAAIEMGNMSVHRLPWGEGNLDMLGIASNIADAAIEKLVDANGILMEPVPFSLTNRDAPQFKGIFIRNLAYYYHQYLRLTGSDPSTVEQYKQFIMGNADAIWEKNRTDENAFGAKWAGTIDTIDAVRQTAALDAFNAATPFGQLPDNMHDLTLPHAKQ